MQLSAMERTSFSQREKVPLKAADEGLQFESLKAPVPTSCMRKDKANFEVRNPSRGRSAATLSRWEGDCLGCQAGWAIC